MRKLILSMNVSLDGYVEGPDGAMDWIAYDDEEQWEALFDLLRPVDTIICGRGMYPGYASYWQATLSNADADKNALRYARLANDIDHIVVSTTLQEADIAGIAAHRTRIAQDPAVEIAQLKQQPGGNIVLWGGAATAASFIRLGLVDAYQLIVNPVVLGGGKSFFRELSDRLSLELKEARGLKPGSVLLRYEAKKEAWK